MGPKRGAVLVACLAFLVIGCYAAVGTSAPQFDAGTTIANLPLGIMQPSFGGTNMLICNETGLYERDLTAGSESVIFLRSFTTCSYALAGNLGVVNANGDFGVSITSGTNTPVPSVDFWVIGGPCQSGQCTTPQSSDLTYNTTIAQAYPIEALTVSSAPGGVLLIKPVPCYFTSGGSSCVQITADDIGSVVAVGVIDPNNDGTSDFVIAASNGSVWYYKGSNTGPAWTKTQTLGVISGVTNIVAVDLQNAGRAQDFVVVAAAGADVYTYTAVDTFTQTAGPAGLTAVGSNVLSGARGVLVADLDGEGFSNDLLWWHTDTDAKLFTSYGTFDAANSYLASYETTIPFIPKNGVIFNPNSAGNLIIASYDSGIQLLTRNGYVPPTTTPGPTTSAGVTTTPSPTTTELITTTPTDTTTIPVDTTTEALTTTPQQTESTTTPPETTTEEQTTTPETTTGVPNFQQSQPFSATMNAPPGSNPIIDIGEFFTVAYVSIIERGFGDVEIQGLHNFNLSMALRREPTTFPDGSIGERLDYEGYLENGAGIGYMMWYMLDDLVVEFADQSISLKKNQLKQGLEIEHWPWKGTRNRLEVSVQFGASRPIIRSGFGQVGEHTVQLMLATETRVLRANFLTLCVLDGKPKGISFSYDQLSQTVIMGFPRFTNSVVIDPDFSVLLADPNDPGAGFPPQKKKSNKNITIGIAVSMSIIAVLILGLVIFFLIFWKHPKVRAFITGNKVQVAAIGSSTNRGLLSSAPV